MSDCYERENSIYETLRHNLGSICTVYTESSEGFTGVLSELNKTSCKLITTNDLPGGGGNCFCDNARRVHTIPLDKITCLSTSRY